MAWFRAVSFRNKAQGRARHVPEGEVYRRLVSGSLFLPHMVWLRSMMAASRWCLAPETLIPLMGGTTAEQAWKTGPASSDKAGRTD